jgi:hypothetical protein
MVGFVTLPFDKFLEICIRFMDYFAIEVLRWKVNIFSRIFYVCCRGRSCAYYGRY